MNEIVYNGDITLLSPGIWVNTSLKQIGQLTQELLSSSLQTQKNHYNFYLQRTLKGLSSPWLPSRQFLF